MGGSKSNKKSAKKRRQMKKNNINNNSQQLDMSNLLMSMSTPSQEFLPPHLIGTQSHELSPTVVNFNQQFESILNEGSDGLPDVFSTPPISSNQNGGKEVTFDMVLSIYKINKCIMGKIASLEHLHQSRFDEIASGMKILKTAVEEITKSQSLINSKFENQAKEIKIFKTTPNPLQPKANKSITRLIKLKRDEEDLKRRIRKIKQK